MASAGKLIVLSAPSGAGKTSIAKVLLQRFPQMTFSVSATTRAMRPGETHGRDYFFLTKEDFRGRIDRGELVEWEEIYTNFYGTLRSEVDRALANGQVMLFDVDVKGALSIKAKYPKDALIIFVAPPSVDELRTRLLNRKTEDAATIERRMARVPMEMDLASKFDHRVVNDDLQRASDEATEIVRVALKTTNGER